jgi:hypothetical protein
MFTLLIIPLFIHLPLEKPITEKFPQRLVATAEDSAEAICFRSVSSSKSFTFFLLRLLLSPDLYINKVFIKIELNSEHWITRARVDQRNRGR